MAAFISATSSALNQACPSSVLNRASSSILRQAMSNQLGMSKKQKPFSLGQQKLNGPIKPNEIFETVWPDGYDSNPLYDQDPDYYVNSGISPTQNSVYMSYPKCHRHISSSSKTKYSNPISHITSCCSGVTYLHSLVCAAREDAGLRDGKEARQQKLHEALYWENLQDLALHTWMKLVCLHNTPIHKMNDSNFCDVINCERISQKTFTNTKLELSLIVEEKIAAEMKGKKGVIMHNGWRKNSRHYVCLLATYLVVAGKTDVLGQQMMESVNTLMTATALPQDEEEHGKLRCTESVIVFSNHPHSHICTCL
jgi:hypothetical protein